MNLAVTSKEEIIGICKKMVMKKGLSAVNMRSVAQECNVAVGSIYNYFPSKNKLFCAVIESIWRDIFSMSEEQYEFSDFVDYLMWLFERAKSGSQKYPAFFSMHAFSFASEDKAAGREVMEQCFLHLKLNFFNVLKKDVAVKEEAFDEVLTPDLFVDYIFIIFISSLSNFEQSCVGLLEIVKRCLY